MSAFSYAVRSRCQLTGESPRYLLNGNLADAQATIAAADDQQAIFESRVMRALLDPPAFKAHPLGVSHIQLPRQGPAAVVHVDAPAQVTEDPIDQAMAHHLLPARTPDGHTTGIAGLRVPRRQGSNRKDLIVRMVNSNARLSFRANIQWRLWLPRWRQEVLDDGCVPLWDSDTITAEEQHALQPEQDHLAWLGSGLLRRIGIYHTTGTAFEVKGSVAEGLWTIQMSIHPDIDPDHDAFVARLIHPAHGLPLTVDSRSCSCETKPPTTHDTAPACRIDLRPCDPQLPGGLQLQFVKSTPPAQSAAKFIAAGADRRWLTRTGLQ